MSSAVILLAAGTGARMKGSAEDKILALLAGRPVLLHSIEAFAQSGVVRDGIVVYRDEEQRAAMRRITAAGAGPALPLAWVAGGPRRRDSVHNALQSLSDAIEYVFIHDCARPLVRPQVIRELDRLVRRDKAAALAHPVTDTIKKADASPPECCRLEDLPRSRLWAMETPQAFARPLIVRAYEDVCRLNRHITDDTGALAGREITLLPNPFPNPKLTWPGDFDLFESILRRQRSAKEQQSVPARPNCL